ncbi:MAG: NUDIX hydrolase [Archangiaceae bacterium]|nr:NUDIX hydrolase [Archangiaceae bacterium]
MLDLDLNSHVPTDGKERADTAAMCVYAATLAEPLSRKQHPAHFTGSAVVLSPDGQRVCMILHGKLHRWLQPGGHAEAVDGGDLTATALREAREETGLEVALHPTAARPFDVDAHVIPAKGDEPKHTHLDVRFAVVAKNPDALKHDPDESSGSKWLGFDEAIALADDPSLKRLLTKARALGAATAQGDAQNQRVQISRERSG